MSARRRRIQCSSLPCLAVALLLSACATRDASRPEPVEVYDVTGFTITEEVRVGAGVRSDFEDAVALLEKEEYERGIELLEQVTTEAPHVTTAHIDLAIAYRRTDELEKAEASIRRALELNPRHPVVHNELGMIQRRTGDFVEARASYEKALELYSDFHFARRNLAILCDVFLKDLECAMQHYELYHEAVPEDEEAAMWIADLQNRVGR